MNDRADTLGEILGIVWQILRWCSHTSPRSSLEWLYAMAVHLCPFDYKIGGPLIFQKQIFSQFRMVVIKSTEVPSQR